MVYNSRGWSLFRLAQHRIVGNQMPISFSTLTYVKQKQQLSYNMLPVPGTTNWLNQLNDNEPYVCLEKNMDQISDTCKRARMLLDLINARGLPVSTIVDMIMELHSLDQTDRKSVV